MNFLRGRMLAVFTLLNFVGQAFGYTWSFTNATDKLMLVQVILLTGMNVDTGKGIYFNIIQPGETKDFSYSLTPTQTVKLAELDWNIQGQNLVMQYKMMNFSQRRDFFSKLVDNREQQKNMLKHSLKVPEVIFLPESTRNLVKSKIESASKKLMDGSAKTMTEALRLVGYDPGVLVGRITRTINPQNPRAALNCDFKIVENKGAFVLIDVG